MNCDSAHAYADGNLLICPECAHEWSPEEAQGQAETVIADANGNPLADGDTVSVIKDLKVKGSAAVVKVGTKVKISDCWIAIAKSAATISIARSRALVR